MDSLADDSIQPDVTDDEKHQKAAANIKEVQLNLDLRNFNLRKKYRFKKDCPYGHCLARDLDVRKIRRF